MIGRSGMLPLLILLALPIGAAAAQEKLPAPAPLMDPLPVEEPDELADDPMTLPPLTEAEEPIPPAADPPPEEMAEPDLADPAADSGAGEPADEADVAAEVPDVAAERPPPDPRFDPLAGTSLDALAATRNAPLFTPSRTAPPPVVENLLPEPDAEEPEPEIADALEEEPPPLQLIGIVTTDAQEVVLLTDPGSSEILRLKPGEDYLGWKLRIVDFRTVEFASGDRTHKLTMFEEFGPAPPPTSSIQGFDPDGNPYPEDMIKDGMVPQPGPVDGMPTEEDPTNDAFSNEVPADEGVLNDPTAEGAFPEEIPEDSTEQPL